MTLNENELDLEDDPNLGSLFDLVPPKSHTYSGTKDSENVQNTKPCVSVQAGKSAKLNNQVNKPNEQSAGCSMDSGMNNTGNSQGTKTRSGRMSRPPEHLRYDSR